MIARFAIEPAVFMDARNDNIDIEANDSRLFECWKLHGVLHWSEDASEFSLAISQLPVTRRKRWTAVMGSDIYRRVFVKDADFGSLLKNEAALIGLSQYVDVICLEETRAACFGLPEDEISVQNGHGVEICRINHVDRSVAFRRAAETWSDHIYSGTDVDQIWKARFEGLLRFASSISIVDRYCVKNSVLSLRYGRSSALQAFLRRIGGVGGARRKAVNIYSSLNELTFAEAQGHLEMISQAHTMPSIASLHLHMAEDKVFQTVSHDRFLRCGPIVTGIGKGISMFESTVCAETYACGLICDEEGNFQGKVEKVLRIEAKYKRIR
jgi:hypothetical protein